MEKLRAVSEKCIACTLCQKECAFLQKYGKPKALADSFDPSRTDRLAMAFECSLCGLCAAVCPVGLDPAGMFLEMRREAVRRGGGDFAKHAVILAFERRGTSKRYSWYGLPEGCDTVFFPGCNLPGTRPGRVMELFEWLQGKIPSLGIVLDCCMKPSHDLGRERVFRAMFDEMKDWLIGHGVRTVLVACPSCDAVFRHYGGPLEVKTVYEVLAETGPLRPATLSGRVVVHDSCAVRFEESIQRAVRDLVAGTGLAIESLPHQRKKTFCCGEGGSVGFLAPELARKWRSRRKDEAAGRRMIVYCGGCAGFLGAVAPTSHVLDLLFDPERTLSGKVKGSRAPWTYWNRIRLKSRFKKKLAAAPVTRQRTFSAE